MSLLPSRIYSVQALNHSGATSFYERIAALTDGFHLKLDQFSSIANFMLAIAYRELGDEPLQQFEDEVRILSVLASVGQAGFISSTSKTAHSLPCLPQ